MTRMNCGEVQDLLTAYLDDELPSDEQRVVATHLASCPHCSEGLEASRSRRARVRAVGTHALPANLEQKVLASIGVEARRNQLTRRRIGLVASHVAAGVAGAMLLYGGLVGVDRSDRIVRDGIAAHTRAQMSGQMIQVASSDSHTVKPWFSTRLPFSPPVRDVLPSEFPLLGGRTDSLDGRPAAVTVYGRRAHRIDVFMQPGDTSAIPPALDTAQNGFALMSWRAGDFTYLAISDLNAIELRRFLAALRGQ